jgi:hypothetical protein
MFSLELKNITQPPPGLSTTLADSAYIFTAIRLDEIEKADKAFIAIKQKPTTCGECKELIKICDEIFKQKLRAVACLAESFKLIQHENSIQLDMQREINSLKVANSLFEDKFSSIKSLTELASEIKNKDKQIQDLVSENRELSLNRIFTQKIVTELENNIGNKLIEIKRLEQQAKELTQKFKLCKCVSVSQETPKKPDQLKETELKTSDDTKIISELLKEKKKKESLQEFLHAIPEINGRELRISIHKKICEIETDFIELAANQENFEIIKVKYLQLPYLLKPIFDLTKQYEKSIIEFKKILYN